MAAWTYILECADRSYYTGASTYIEQREAQHQDGVFGGYTSLRRPVKLVWSMEVQTIHDAIAMERRIKGWSRAKKQALIEGRYDDVPMLARKPRKPKG